MKKNINLKNFNKNLNTKFKSLPVLSKKNDIGKTKYFPPYFKEWNNTAYFYNKNIIKNLSFVNLYVNKLIKIYFNLFYAYKYEKISIKKRRRILRKIFISKAEIKYTSSIAIITFYSLNWLNSSYKTYKKKLNYWMRTREWMWKWEWLVKRGNTSWDKRKRRLYKSKPSKIKIKKWIRLWPMSILKQIIRPNLMGHLGIKLINKQENLYSVSKFNSIIKFGYIFVPNNLILRNINNILEYKFKFYHKMLESFYLNMIKRRIYEIKNLYSYKLINLWKYYKVINIDSIKLRNENNNNFIIKLKKMLSFLLRKKVKLNIINLKSHSYNTEFFTESLALKLKKNKFNMIKSMINIININNFSERKNNGLKLLKRKDLNELNNMYKNPSLISMANKNNLNFLLKRIYYTSMFSPVKNNKLYLEILKQNYNKIYSIIFDNIKFKNLSGIRLEVKGRLTKRYRADRSLYKLLWKGSLKNKDSSFKGISSVMFKGNWKSNVNYSIIKQKRKIGAFAIKGWIAGK
jgi:hypothetical protein